MKRIILITVTVAVSFAAGWYFGYTRPAAQHERKILAAQHQRKPLKEVESVRDMMASLDREDEVLATVALATVQELERGDSEAAKERLLYVLGGYYRTHRTNELYTNLIVQIEKAAQESPSIAAEIAKHSE